MEVNLCVFKKPTMLILLLLSVLMLGHAVRALTSASPLVPNSNCTLLRDSFSNATSWFTGCAINNSRPITLCENCIDAYMQVVSTYSDMFTHWDNLSRCIDHFVDQDRLQIVRTLHDNNYQLWNNAKCYECFENVNGSLSPNRSAETATFNKYYDSLMECLNRTDVNDTNLCPICMKDYTALNDYYISISNENEKIGVCMDIVDLMNNTRCYWSDKCCKYRKHNEAVFLIFASLVLALPLLFYVLVPICFEKQSPTILRQRRFAESLSQADHT